MSNIMSKVRFSNNPSRNAFDLSHKTAFTAKAGELLPIYVEEVIPGDKFKISPKWFTRTEPLNTAAYTRLTEHIDFYYVPMRILWRYADSFFSQTDFSQSAKSITESGPTSPTKHPYFTLEAISRLLESRQDAFDSAAPVGRNLFGFNRSDLSLKLLQYLGYGDIKQHIEETNINVLHRYNPFPLLAYQCVYQYFERNDAWERMRSDFFNVDYLTGSDPEIDCLSLNGSLDDMFDMRYANWRKDLFTGLLPNAQYGDEASASVIGSGLPADYRFATNSGNISNADMSPAVVTNGQINNNSVNINKLILQEGQIGNLPIIALRQAEALQRLKEVKQSNKYDYKSQIEALWNVNVSRERANMPYRIGGFVNGINIDEVVNTSITDNGNERQAANIAGKGATAGSGHLEFTASDNGIIIGIYKVTPELDYLPHGVDRLHLKTDISEYANPLFDKLGMESVRAYELIQHFTYEESNGIPDESVNLILGYAPRYYEYKTKVDRIYGAFATQYQDTWVAPYSREYIFNQWKESFDATGKLLNFGFFKINPMVLNPIFTSQIYEDENSGYQYICDYSNEQFKINMFFDVKAVRNLDYNGLPY